MEDGLECLSTEEIVHIIKNKPLEFQSISLANLLAQLIRRSLLALQLVNVRGIPKLVALLSYESVSVRFNALLAFGNLLRHCPTTHSEAVRLGTLRKLAFLFQEAQEEPQQNLCVDTFLCLCDSDLPGMFDELQRNGIVNHALNWIHCTTSERVCKKVALTALESACCKEDSGMQRTHFVCNGGVKILMQIVESKNIILLIQAIQMLALLAVLDEKARQ